MIKKLKILAEQLNKSTSNLDKIKVLQKNKSLKDILTRIYDPDVLFNVTSKNCMKNYDVVAMSMNMDLDQLLEALAERRLTGNAAIGACNAFAGRLPEDSRETFWNIIDKDLKCRVGVKMLEKAFATEIKKFNVALANSYSDVCEKINVFDGTWYQSKKMDGCLEGSTSIEFEDGSIKTIQDVVENKINGNIKTYNTRKKKIEFKPILNHMKNLVDVQEDNNDWFEIELEDGRKIILTGNHQVFLPQLKCFRRTDLLSTGDSILMS
jgi:hypothetical protein